MYVQMKIGAYAGEIRDIRSEEARQLIASGAAVDARELDRTSATEIPPEVMAKVQAETADTEISKISKNFRNGKKKR